VFDSQLFQRSHAKKKRRDNNARQTNSTKDLQEGETNAKGSIDPNYNISPIGRRRVFASIVPATLEEGPSTTPFASRKIKQTKNR